jgi:hypothetical protein
VFAAADVAPHRCSAAQGALPRRLLPAAAVGGATAAPPPWPAAPQLPPPPFTRAFRPAAADAPAAGDKAAGAPPKAVSASAGGADAPPASGTELRILRELGQYIWPKDRPDLRARVGIALGLLMASKVRPYRSA